MNVITKHGFFERQSCKRLSRELCILLASVIGWSGATVTGQDLDLMPVGQRPPEIEWGQVGEMRGNLGD